MKDVDAFGDVLRWIPGSLPRALQSPGNARNVDRISGAVKRQRNGTRNPDDMLAEGG
jgi:hypothetical protein